jgi:DNA (cytosine-5)-methyltransferase 1
MKMLDLFSGIAGFSLAAEWAGIETVAFCECDPFCRRVIKKHWPEKPIFYDVRRLNGYKVNRNYGTIDIITGGIPCQPASLAGKQKGTQDHRWLWPSAFRIVREINPTWVLFENVYGLVTLDRGVVFQDLLSELESIGYEVQAFIIPACAVDAPHRRDRVWIVAYSNDGQRTREKRRILESESGKTRDRFTGCSEDVSNTISLNDDRCGHGTSSVLGKRPKTSELPRRENVSHASRELRYRDGSPRDGSPRDGSAKPSNNYRRSAQSRLGRVVDGLSSGLDGYWPAEPQDIPRTAKGIVNRTQRLKALGNSVVPELVFRFLRQIQHAEQENAGLFSELKP